MKKRLHPEIIIARNFQGNNEPVVNPAILSHYDPTIVRAEAANEKENVIEVFGFIGPTFFDEGGGITAKSIAAALRGFAGKPVTLNINSPGGIFFEGLAIYNILRTHDAEITANILGLAASAASIIAMAGDTIRMVKASFMMIHNTQGFAMGDRHVFLDMAATMAELDKSLVSIFAARTSIDEDEIAAMLDKERLFSADTAVEEGWADELIPDREVAKGDEKNNQRNVTKKLEMVLAASGMSRSERRDFVKEIRGMPRAASNGKPGAAELREVSNILGSIELPKLKGK